MRAFLLLACLSACAAPTSRDTRIEGTVVNLRMIPILGARISMSATEITWDAYDVFVYGLDGPDPEVPAGVDAIARPSRPSAVAFDRGFGHAGYPAISISFHGAQEFCRWLSARTGRRFRLPTEDEWVLAAGSDRAGRELVRPEGGTAPVGKQPMNDLGFHDMLGNAAEWCTTADGKGVLRGGSYRDDASVAARLVPTPDWNRSDPQIPKSKWWLADAPFAGFRVVREE